MEPGTFGEKGPTLIVGKPGQICTETFLVVGPFKDIVYADRFIKYFKTKFFRALVGILKSTQHSTGTYKFVPLEVIYDDTIDWSGSLENLDKCLYKKYEFN